MRWAGNVECIAGKICSYRVLVGHLQDLDLDAILILKLDLQTSEKMAWTELLRHMIGITFGLL